MTTNQRNIAKLIKRTIVVLREEQKRKYVSPSHISTKLKEHNIIITEERITEYCEAMCNKSIIRKRYRSYGFYDSNILKEA